MNESELLGQLSAEVEALRLLLLGIGELITSTITRIDSTSSPVIDLSLNGFLETSAEAEVTHADGTKG